MSTDKIVIKMVVSRESHERIKQIAETEYRSIQDQYRMAVDIYLSDKELCGRENLRTA